VGRKSRTDERRAQILSAFERCIVRKGLHRTTLDDVALEAGIARPLIRHNVGNWDNLVRAATERLTDVYSTIYQSHLARAREKKDLHVITGFLFSTAYGTATEDQDMVLNAMSSAAQTDDTLRDLLKSMYQRFEKSLVDEIVNLYGDVSRAEASNVAYAIICLAEQNSMFQAWGFPAGRARSVRQVADDLLTGLLVR